MGQKMRFSFTVHTTERRCTILYVRFKYTSAMPRVNSLIISQLTRLFFGGCSETDSSDFITEQSGKLF
jgi:hypothetical protein